jgi:hypothetical protein
LKKAIEKRSDASPKSSPEERVDEILNPASETISHGDVTIKLTPSKDSLLVFLPPKDSLGDSSELWSVIPSKGFDPRKSLISKGDTHSVYYISRTMLRSRKELLEAAQAGRLPLLLMVYESGGVRHYPLGSITVRVKDDPDGALGRAFAAKHKLGLIEGKNHQIQFVLTKESSFSAVFKAARILGRQSFVEWAEPDMATSVMN